MTRSDVENVLLRIGVPAGPAGFTYIVDAILLMDKYQNIKMITELYTSIAELHKTTWTKVERSMRYAFHLARKYGKNSEVVEHYMGNSSRGNSGHLKTLYLRIKEECDEVYESVRGPAACSMMHVEEDKIREIVRQELKVILKGSV